MEKPLVIERFADNGEHSHWELIDSDGNILWTEPDNDCIEIKGPNLEIHIQ